MRAMDIIARGLEAHWSGHKVTKTVNLWPAAIPLRSIRDNLIPTNTPPSWGYGSARQRSLILQKAYEAAFHEEGRQAKPSSCDGWRWLLTSLTIPRYRNKDVPLGSFARGTASIKKRPVSTYSDSSVSAVSIDVSSGPTFRNVVLVLSRSSCPVEDMDTAVCEKSHSADFFCVPNISIVNEAEMYV